MALLPVATESSWDLCFCLQASCCPRRGDSSLAFRHNHDTTPDRRRQGQASTLWSSGSFPEALSNSNPWKTHHLDLPGRQLAKHSFSAGKLSPRRKSKLQWRRSLTTSARVPMGPFLSNLRPGKSAWPVEPTLHRLHLCRAESFYYHVQCSLWSVSQADGDEDRCTWSLVHLFNHLILQILADLVFLWELENYSS